MTQNPHDDMIGKLIFNKYKPKQKLGEGSFGKIYIAKDIKTGEDFALKIVYNY